jgi:hypothetical protein
MGHLPATSLTIGMGQQGAYHGSGGSKLISTEEKIQPSRKPIRHSHPMRIEINCFLSSYTTDHSAHIQSLDLSFSTGGCRIRLLIWSRLTGACISTMRMLGWTEPRPRRLTGELTCHDSKRSRRRLIRWSSSTTLSRSNRRRWRDRPRLVQFVMFAVLLFVYY